MAYFGISATDEGLRAAVPGVDVEGGLGAALAGVRRADAPVVVLVHGYRWHPDAPGGDPHRSLFALAPEDGDRRIRSWPEGLGFDDTGASGLCIGFGWPASAPHLRSLLATGRNGFARVYDTAGAVGARLAEVIRLVQRLAPGRPVDVFAHSLGARVALAALPHLDEAPGRMILLGAAEFDAAAHGFLDASPAAFRPQVYNVTARANDLYDLMFETFAPRKGWRDRAIGRGLTGPVPGWIDLQLDRADVTAWINARGIPLQAPEARLCHWSFYTRDGALAVYQAILRRRPGWDVAGLRAAPCFGVQEPRWSRILPRRRPAAAAEAAGLPLGGRLHDA
jgi:hypothetical protein